MKKLKNEIKRKITITQNHNISSFPVASLPNQYSMSDVKLLRKKSVSTEFIWKSVTFFAIGSYCHHVVTMAEFPDK